MTCKRKLKRWLKKFSSFGCYWCNICLLRSDEVTISASEDGEVPIITWVFHFKCFKTLRLDFLNAVYFWRGLYSLVNQRLDRRWPTEALGWPLSIKSLIIPRVHIRPSKLGCVRKVGPWTLVCQNHWHTYVFEISWRFSVNCCLICFHFADLRMLKSMQLLSFACWNSWWQLGSLRYDKVLKWLW